MSPFRTPDIKKMKEKKNIKGLIKALRHEEGRIRADAAEALGDLADPTAVLPLCQALKVGSVGEKVLKALSKIGDTRAIEPLTSYLQKNFEEHHTQYPTFQRLNYELRPSIAATLISLGYQPGNTESDAIFFISSRQWDKCVQVGAVAFEPLYDTVLNDKVLKPKEKEAAINALLEINKQLAVTRLIESLQSDNHDDLLRALWIFCQYVSDPRAVEAIGNQFLNGINEQVWCLAGSALLKNRNQDAADLLLEGFDKYLGLGKADVVEHLIPIMGALGDKRARASLSMIKGMSGQIWKFMIPKVDKALEQIGN
jgi:HEAT repeat protein